MQKAPKIPLTKEKYAQVQADFKRLKSEREETMQRLQTAREMGDLSENGAYKYAKFELGNIGRALRRVRHLLENGEVREKASGEIASFGSSVTVDNGKKQTTYVLVSEHESDPSERRISLESPLGSALLGKRAGDTVQVTAPVGQIEYRIVRVA